MKFFAIFAIALSICTSSPRCTAQEVVDVIHLSAEEAAKAKQMLEDVKDAQDRRTRARLSWQNFYQSFQAAHPELTGLKFSSDFRVAFAVNRVPEPVSRAAIAVELSPEDRKKAESLHREMLESAQAHDQSRKSWRDCQYEIVASHIPSTGEGDDVILPSGKSVRIPNPWGGGLAFTPDFRIAVPRY